MEGRQRERLRGLLPLGDRLQVQSIHVLRTIWVSKEGLGENEDGGKRLKYSGGTRRETCRVHVQEKK